MTAYDHPDYLAFIDAIRANPDCDDLRRAVADWLREKGEDARADFIQCQIEKAELERASGGKLPVKVVRAVPTEYRPRMQELRAYVAGPPIPSGPKPGDVIDFARQPFNMQSEDWYVIGCSETVTTTSLNLVPSHPCPLRDRWRELVKMEGELLTTFRKHEWAAVPMARRTWSQDDREYAVCNATIYCTYSSGFLESIRIRGADWIDHNAEILKRNPVRKCVLIANPPPADFGFMEGFAPRIETGGYSNGRWPGIEFTFEREAINVGSLTLNMESWRIPVAGGIYASAHVANTFNVRTQYD